jgi:DnaJ-class molecular chaperone
MTSTQPLATSTITDCLACGGWGFYAYRGGHSTTCLHCGGTGEHVERTDAELRHFFLLADGADLSMD